MIFEGEGGDLYLGVVELMETCPQSVAIGLLEPTCYRKLIHQKH